MDIIKPIVRDISLYREIVKNIVNPSEILREAISNSVDAEAKNIEIKSYRNDKGAFSLEFIDDGNGMGEKEIQEFFNLGDSSKGIQNIGEKGLGTKIFFRSEKLTVESYNGEGVAFFAIMETPWEKLQRGVMPTYKLEKNFNHDNKVGTRIRIENFFINNPEKYFNLEMMKDYIRWFTAGGSFKNIFANYVELNRYVKNMQVAPRIFIKDEINKLEEEISGSHQFHQPQENPPLDDSQRRYKHSSNYCRHFGPYHRTTNIDGECVSFQLYGTISGSNCRKKLAKLKVGEKYKGRFGIYLAKDFIPIVRHNALLPYEKFYHFHLLLNSQNFDLTADRNNVSNLNDKKVKWILDTAKEIIDTDIIPVVQASYFKMRKQEDTRYIESTKQKNLNLNYEKTNELNDLQLSDICLKKEPYNSFTTLFTLIALLSHKVYRRYIKEIDKLEFYTNDLIYRICCSNKKEGLAIVGIEYKLSQVLNINILKGLNYIVCWKVDVEIVGSEIKEFDLKSTNDKYQINLGDKVIKVIELSQVINNIRINENER